jgi:hypothetical protein
MPQASIVAELIADAAKGGADAIEVEYKDCREEVVAMCGPIGFGIASIPSSEAKGTALREELWGLRRRATIIMVSNVAYRVRVRTYDSFGEKAFRVDFEQAKTGRTNRSTRRAGAARA